MLDRVWIGSAADFYAPLACMGFSGVVDLRDGEQPSCDTRVTTHRIDQRDGDPWNREQVLKALAFVAEQVKKGPVLIACAAGMSRSACMVIGFLVMTGWDVPSAFRRVKEVRPQVAPIPAMLASVLAAVAS